MQCQNMEADGKAPTLRQLPIVLLTMLADTIHENGITDPDEATEAALAAASILSATTQDLGMCN